MYAASATDFHDYHDMEKGKRMGGQRGVQDGPDSICMDSLVDADFAHVDILTFLSLYKF